MGFFFFKKAPSTDTLCWQLQHPHDTCTQGHPRTVLAPCSSTLVPHFPKPPWWLPRSACIPATGQVRLQEFRPLL